MMNREYVGVDISKKYCDDAKERLKLPCKNLYLPETADEFNTNSKDSPFFRVGRNCVYASILKKPEA